MEQLMVIQFLLKKVELDISKLQMVSLAFIIKAYLVNHLKVKLTDPERVTCFHLYKVYEKKIRPKEISTKTNIKLKFDVTEAFALRNALNNINTGGLPYETALIDYITGEIDRQTC
jgi:hypothetical protein